MSRNLYSDTPQGSLRNVESEEYLTNASKDMTDSEGTNEISLSLLMITLSTFGGSTPELVIPNAERVP